MRDPGRRSRRLIVKVTSGTVIGIDAYPVEVEADLAQGMPQFATVGLPDVAVRESKERIRAAIRNSGYPFPRKHITVNLAPADVKKEGTAFDLPIALAILAAEEVFSPAALDDYVFMGELSLDGSIKAVSGVLPVALLMGEKGKKGFIVGEDNAAEAALSGKLEVIPVKTLSSVIEFLSGRLAIEPYRLDLKEVFDEVSVYPIDFADIKGQEQAKRALEVAAAGGHNILMIGPPGAGKTMLAQRLITILPELTFEEALETTKIFSVAGLLGKGEQVLKSRPFRSPHHTISDAGLVGGGQIPRPGEISLAHNGVLFLDELPEFKRNVLEALRQPLEEGTIHITRSTMSVIYPARFMLVASMNPCYCGFFGDRRRPCSCTAQQIRQYQGKVSGPLLDRIDIHIEVPALSYGELLGRSYGEDSRTIRERVKKARLIQLRRANENGIFLNAHMTEKELKAYCVLDEESRKLLEAAIDRLGLSARAYTRILKVARTIADLEGEENIRSPHISEAIQYRSLDRRII